MQNFTDIPSTRTLSDSLAEILNNDKTAISCSSGTAFPTANLQLGMLCFRTDQNKLYILKATSPSAVWVEIMDVTASSGKAPNAEAVDGIDGSAVLLKASNLSDLANAATARSNLGIGNVENKSSATIRSEITSGNVTGALGYTPVNKAGDTMTGPLYMPSLSKVGGGGYGVLLFGDNAAADDFHIVRESSGLNIYSGLFGSGIRRFGVDPSGRVTMPAQPKFYAQHASSSNGHNRYGLFNVPYIDSANVTHSTFGGSYSYTRFTAPVAGTYLVWAGSIGPSATNTLRIYIRKNGVNASPELRIPQSGNHAVNASLVAIVNCSAGDWISAFASDDAGVNGFYENTYSHFGVMLMG